MTNEEYEKLKFQLQIEERKRLKIAELEREIKFWKNDLGLVAPNGWTADMKLEIHQTGMESLSADGNSDWGSIDYLAIIDNPKDIEIFFDALHEVVINKIKELNKLKEEVEND